MGMRRLLLFAVLVTLLYSPGPLLAQESDTTGVVNEACSSSDFRAFDFWLGHWVVRDSTGKQVGTSHISSIAGGCGIREEWSGSSGSRGTSLNYYDPADERWHQDWVGSGGQILHLTGGVTDSEMILEGKRMGEDGPIRDRIRWRTLEDGGVRQEWTISRDGGETWERAFLGFYEAAGEAQ